MLLSALDDELLHVLFTKYFALSFQRERITSESVMLEKLFLTDENKLLKSEKELVATNPGKSSLLLLAIHKIKLKGTGIFIRCRI